MCRGPSDDTEYRFFTTPGAEMRVRLVPVEDSGQELQLFGNRAGILSLANVLLWFLRNAWRREFLSLGELPFVRLEGEVAVCIRMPVDERTDWDGYITRTDRGEQFEWVLGEDDLQKVALIMHGLASEPGHEYDRLLMAPGSAVGIQVRMTDAAAWLGRDPVDPP